MQEILNEEIKSLELHVDNFSSHRWYCIMFIDCRVTIPSLYNIRDKFFGTSIKLNGKMERCKVVLMIMSSQSCMHAYIYMTCASW